MKTRFTFIVLSLFVSASALSDSDHATPKGSSRVGEKMAVTAFDPEEGFQMSARALKTLGIEFKPVQGNGPWEVPEKALVRIKHTSGVYRRYQNWISFVLVEVAGRKNGQLLIRSEDLEPQDEVAFVGASFLRLTEADLNSDTVDSCSN